MIRIVVADDPPIFREGLRKTLSSGAELRVVGEASNGDQALALCAKIRPDVLVLDLEMPRCDGFVVLDRLSRISPGTRTVVLTARVDRESQPRALAAGARAFLRKDTTLDVILEAVRAVAAG